MGWFKKLRKKLTIKSAASKIGSITKFIPGGEAIKAAISTVSSSVKKLTSKSDSKKTTAQVSVTSVDTPEATAQGKNMMMIAAAALAGFFFLKK